MIVSGVFTKASGGPVTVAADSISPLFQSVRGTFSSLDGQPGSDNKTGVFQLTPCASILGSQNVTVVTDSQTSFLNTSGLSTLSALSPLVARGLLFYAVNGTKLNDINIPAGSLVLLATSVRQS